MTFKEFRQTIGYKTAGYYVLTTCDHDDAKFLKHQVLEWEPSNQKWYQPVDWGRKEAGYLNVIGDVSRIVHMRVL